MITHLHLRNMRGIAEGTLQDCAQINLLIGPNNVGKTTIVEALYLATTADVLCKLVVDTSPQSTNTMHTTVALSAASDMMGYRPMARVWQRHTYPPCWEDAPAQWDQGTIKLTGLPDALHTCAMLYPRNHGQAFASGDEKRTVLFSIKQHQAHAGNDKAGKAMPPFVQAYFGDAAATWGHGRFTFLWHPPFTYNENGLAGWFTAGDLPKARNTLLCDWHMLTAPCMTSLITRASNTWGQWTKQLAAALSYVFDTTFGDITIQLREDEPQTGPPHDTLFVQEQGKPPRSIDLWGISMRQAAHMLMPLLLLSEEAEQGHSGLVLWEDPELGMNPLTLQRLLKYIVTTIQNKPIQLFLTTQSIEVVACLTRMLREKEVPQAMIKAFQLHRFDGKLASSRFKAHNLIAWLETGLDPRIWEQEDTPVLYRLGGME